MGPLFVLIFWIIAGSLLSLAGGALLVKVVALLTVRVRVGQKRALSIARVLPALGFAYLFLCILIFSFWSTARGRDWGWGDTWDTPILGNYHLMMIDVTDQGTIYDRADPNVFQNGSVMGGGPAQKNVIFGVRRFEVRPPFLLGEASPNTFTESPTTPPQTIFFVLDTRDNSREDAPNLAALQARARQMPGGPLQLQPVNVIYKRFRYTWPDLIPVLLFTIPPLVALLWLTRALLRLRRKREPLLAST